MCLVTRQLLDYEAVYRNTSRIRWSRSARVEVIRVTTTTRRRRRVSAASTATSSCSSNLTSDKSESKYYDRNSVEIDGLGLVFPEFLDTLTTAYVYRGNEMLDTSEY